MSIHDINAAFAREESLGAAAAIARNKQRIEHLLQLGELASDHRFKDYRRELMVEVELLKEQLVNPTSTNVEFLRGEIAGLRRAIAFFEIRAQEADALESDNRDLQEKVDITAPQATTYSGEDVSTPN